VAIIGLGGLAQNDPGPFFKDGVILVATLGVARRATTQEDAVSHIVTIKTEVRDAEAVRAACNRLGLEQPVQGTARLFEGEATGLLVRLPGWLYPAVVETATGQVRYDNYQGAWGDPKHLDAFLQGYAVEKAKIEARKRGHTVYEQPLPDGSVKLTIQVGGGA
jgi:hypothetical protein